MRTIISSLLLMVAAAVAAERYEITGIKTSQQYACINMAWVHDVLCLEVTLRVNDDLGKGTPAVKAYFYNKDNQKLQEHVRPTSVSGGGGNSYVAPDSYRPGKKYTVYFGVSGSIQRGKDKWKHAVIVFGDAANAVAEAYPKADPSQFEFKEKALVLKTTGTSPGK